MASNLRELRERRNSVATTQKITRAMELIASSRIVRAQRNVRSATPYSQELTRALSAVIAHTREDHPLTRATQDPKRSAVLLITSDRGLAGSYSSNVLKAGEGLIASLEGQEVDVYLCGRKAVQYFDFRKRGYTKVWDGFSDSPSYDDARKISDELIRSFLEPTEEGGVDQIHIVYTHFESMLTQKVRVLRLLPMEIIDAADDASDADPADSSQPDDTSDVFHEYHFEPHPATVLDQLLPLYVANRVHFALLQAAASELASRQQAMKSATDNAEQLIDTLGRQANQARQAAITQEITEIVGGAAALAESTSQE
ncbi:F0F1 ATP synthase subunit gamma [Cutibacterium granulosum]|uniref:F0F1 ATP synthase subunit gamma n=1 Tax=Cutibacterium granulosum TaxID=33011 RepID=UPI0025732BA3|nr:F0F1 ATP synthase subunit gamma [Cutibacterium granulosum]MDU1523336.1 F0F1 ATP synthase subunit gamma [Cutibacterium granulosum]MDU4680085.1 F0F1 ATP synthase subunit gamma [Cutibacterium avidum]MDU7728023.1 F0F1 ATP synthase subunit gamma [Cutibacterium granulosum]BDQ40257.1 ATP synthase gamma chain [Cutibacterium granulosum]